MPWYRKHGKILVPLSHADFVKALDAGHFARLEHKGFFSLLYYTGIRKAEGLRSLREQFTLIQEEIFYEVGKRLKHGRHTKPLNILLEKPGAQDIWSSVEATKPGARVWPYSSRTGYNIVERALGFYPHYLRLSRITNFLLEGYPLIALQNWTGLSLATLDSYSGLVDTIKMGRSIGSQP